MTSYITDKFQRAFSGTLIDGKALLRISQGFLGMATAGMFMGDAYERVMESDKNIREIEIQTIRNERNNWRIEEDLRHKLLLEEIDTRGRWWSPIRTR